LLSQAKLAHFNIPNWARLLLPIAKELGLIIACDIQDVVNVEDPYRQDFIHYADFLFFSAVNQSDQAGLIKAFLNIQPSMIIVAGMGAQGCALGTKQGIQYFDPVHMQSPVVDTNGAGDSLAVGFLCSYILDGYSLHDSIRRGQISARYTCTLKASSKLITSAQLDHYFNQ
jgi:sugar/nucleoside kinase (ribokinase family)